MQPKVQWNAHSAFTDDWDVKVNVEVVNRHFLELRFPRLDAVCDSLSEP
jgi:hypothetical protein